jgi:hypothetical protein
LIHDIPDAYAKDESSLSANQRRKREKKERERQQAEQAVFSESDYYNSTIDWLQEAGFQESYLEQERLLGYEISSE